jgi:hypothetical protein
MEARKRQAGGKKEAGWRQERGRPEAGLKVDCRQDGGKIEAG